MDEVNHGGCDDVVKTVMHCSHTDVKVVLYTSLLSSFSLHLW